MVTHRSLKKVVEDAGYILLDADTGRHIKATVADTTGRVAKIIVSVSPRSKSHWPQFVLADIKRKMR
jgi:hypothetical protein